MFLGASPPSLSLVQYHNVLLQDFSWRGPHWAPRASVHLALILLFFLRNQVFEQSTTPCYPHCRSSRAIWRPPQAVRLGVSSRHYLEGKFLSSSRLYDAVVSKFRLPTLLGGWILQLRARVGTNDAQRKVPGTHMQLGFVWTAAWNHRSQT